MTRFMKRKTIFSLITALGLLFGSFAMAQDTAQKEQPADSVDVAKLMQPGKLKEMTEGRADAPVTIIEYASVTCSHCADFYQNTLPQIREKYIKTGKARLVFREFPYEPVATAGFMVARCAPDDRYFPLIDVLFTKQAEWAFGQDVKEQLLKIAKLAGFTQASFEACLRNQELLDNMNADVKRAANEFGIRATPTFFINGQKYEGALTVEKMSGIIDNLL